MSAKYTIRATPDPEYGSEFDTILERDWAGLISRMGLRRKREPFALRRGTGPTTALNVVARPDFFLPDIAVVFECKPTIDHVMGDVSKWHLEAAITGLPVVVTTSRPTAQWTFNARRQDEVLLPPVMAAFFEDGHRTALLFGQCPDCSAFGLWGRDFWLSPCRHQLREMLPVTRALFPRCGERRHADNRGLGWPQS